MSQQQPNLTTRTRQDLINSGDLFRTNEKFAQKERERNEQQKISSRLKMAAANHGHSTQRGSSMGASECCYSICNLALVIASVISLFILIRFLQDEPLFEYGEYLLGLAFYRQLIYLLCLVPFILLLPIWNAMSALVFSFHNSDHNQAAAGKSSASSGGMLKLRLVYQFLLFALGLLGLVFMAPYISRTSVASQIEFEFRRMLKMRFESDFHYQLVDRIQETYECCDDLWYRANLQDGVPLTCFKPRTNFTLVYGDTCPDVLGLLVSTRCAILAACLFAILVALASLFAIDCERLLSQGDGGKTRGAYEIAPDAPGDHHLGVKNARDLNALARTSSGPMRRSQEDAQEGDRESLASGSRGLEELEEEAERELPLLNSFRSPPDVNESIRDDDDDDDDDKEEEELPTREDTASTHSRRSRFLQEQDRQDSPIVLTRADYKTIVRQRSQSPVFVSSAPATSTMTPTTATTTTTSGAPQKPVVPIKSALKSGSSQQNVSNEPETGGGQPYNGFATYRPMRDVEDEDDDSLISAYTEQLRKSDSLLRQKQLQRRDQLRKSLQSVRFADENP